MLEPKEGRVQQIRTNAIDRIVVVLAIVASALSAVNQLPVAFGMAAVPTYRFPFAPALVFLVALGGSILLLASGLRAFAPHMPQKTFLVGFVAVLFLTGVALFWSTPRFGLLGDWITMSCAICIIAALLGRRWLWAVIGGLWAAILAAVPVFVSVHHLISPSDTTVLSLGRILLRSAAFLIALFASATAFASRSEQRNLPL